MNAITKISPNLLASAFAYTGFLTADNRPYHGFASDLITKIEADLAAAWAAAVKAEKHGPQDTQYTKRDEDTREDRLQAVYDAIPTCPTINDLVENTDLSRPQVLSAVRLLCRCNVAAQKAYCNRERHYRITATIGAALDAVRGVAAPKRPYEDRSLAGKRMIAVRAMVKKGMGAVEMADVLGMSESGVRKIIRKVSK